MNTAGKMDTAGSTATAQRNLRDPPALSRPPRPRPMLLPALALAGGIWIADVTGPVTSAARILTVLAPVVAFALLLRPRHRNALQAGGTAALVAIMAFAVGFARYQLAVDQPPHHIAHVLADQPVLTRLAGRIVTSPIERPPTKRNPFLVFDPPPRTQFVLAVDELRTTRPPTPVTGHIRVGVDARGLKLALGQRVQLTGRLYRPRGPRNPGEVDWALWYRRQGIDAGLSVDGAAYVLPLPDPPALLPRLVNTLRRVARGLLFEPFADADADECAQLLDTMVLGQRSAADQKLNEVFLRAGGAHFLAVSGFNVSLLAGAAWWLVRRVLRRGSNAAALSAVAVVVLFALITEPNAPILRAAVVGILAAMAAMTRRPICWLNWLALAAGFVLLYNPQELFRAGFQLSFLQVLALITIVPRAYYPLSDWLTAAAARAYRRIAKGGTDELTPSDAQTVGQLVCLKLVRGLTGLVLVCVMAWAISLPLVLLHFGRLAPWGWLGTVLLTPLVTGVTLLSFAVLLANAVVPPLGVLLGGLLHATTSALLWSVGLFEYFPGALVECRSPPAWLVAGSYVLGVLLYVRRSSPPDATEAKTGPRPPSRLVHPLTMAKAVAAAVTTVAWTAWLVLPAGPRAARYDLHVLAVGDGNTVLLTTPSGRAVVFDVGTDTNSDAGEIAATALRALGVRRVEAVVVSHANVDHYSGLPTLMKRVRVARWFVTPYFGRPDAPAMVRGLLEQLSRAVPAPQLACAGDRLSIAGIAVEIIWPPAGLDDGCSVNDRSMVARLTAGGRAVLLTGDIERDALRALLDAEQAGRLSLRADVLLTPHHGAILDRLTADFYAAVSPSVVVVSSRTPRPKLSRLVADTLGPACQVLRTGEAGAVVVRLAAGGHVRAETPFTAAPPPP